MVKINDLLLTAVLVFTMALAVSVAGPTDLKDDAKVAERVASDEAGKDPAFVSDADFAAAVNAASNFNEFKVAYAKKLASDKVKVDKVKEKKGKIK